MLFHFRRLNIFRPEKLFESSVSFGADIQFNERKTEYDWNKICLLYTSDAADEL